MLHMLALLQLTCTCGVQSQRSGSARRRQRRSVNQRFLLAMTDMGIPADKAELALYETGNVGVEASSLPAHHARMGGG